MDKKIIIVGGDTRNLYLSKLFEMENYKVIFIDDYDRLNLIDSTKTIIGPIPISKDGKNLYTENSNSQIPLKDFFKYCNEKKLIAGAISQDILQLAIKSNVDIIDIMKDESLTILNTIATAEGAVQVAMNRTKITIQGCNILILGFGRVGRVTAQKFAALHANVTCAARKPEARAWIKTCGYNYININDMDYELGNFDIIINTPPTLILSKERLERLKKNCLIIDLASRPGGVDREAVKQLGINFEWALALPGKVAPITSAEYIKDAIVRLGLN